MKDESLQNVNGVVNVREREGGSRLKVFYRIGGSSRKEEWAVENEGCLHQMECSCGGKPEKEKSSFRRAKLAS